MSKYSRLSLVFPLAPILLTSNILMPVAAKEAVFSLTCVGTETDYPINFQYRWGNSKWKTVNVGPGKWKLLKHKYQYPGENRSPELHVRYDTDLTARSAFALSELKSYASPASNCERYGRTYNFHAKNSKIYLVDDEARTSSSAEEADLRNAICVGATIGALISGNHNAASDICNGNPSRQARSQQQLIVPQYPAPPVSAPRSYNPRNTDLQLRQLEIRNNNATRPIDQDTSTPDW